MGIFSKLGRITSDIGSGFATGLGSGLESLSKEWERERQQRSSQDITRQGAIKSQLGRDVYQSGPAGRNRLGINPQDSGLLTTSEVDKLLIESGTVVNNLQPSYVTGKDDLGREGPAATVTINTVTTNLGNVGTRLDVIDQFLRTHSEFISPEERERIDNERTILEEEQVKLKNVYQAVVKRDTKNPVLRQQLEQWQGIRNEYGYNQYVPALEALGVDEATRDQLSALQRYEVVSGLVSGGAGGFRKARQFAMKHGREDQPSLISFIDNKQALSELGVVSGIAEKTYQEARNQNGFQQAYDLASGMEDGVKKENLLNSIFNASAAMLETEQNTYNSTLLNIAQQTAREWNSLAKGEHQLQGSTASLALQAQQQAEFKGDRWQQKEPGRLYASNDPEVMRHARQQLDFLMPHIPTRNKYESQQIGNLTIPDVVAIQTLQQMNLGLDAIASRQFIKTNKALTQEERVKALRLFEEVGAEIGFDVIVDDRNDAQTLTDIHKGFPAYWNQTTVIEQRMFEGAISAIDSSVNGFDEAGMKVDKTTVYDAMEIARANIEMREMKGILPTGSSNRLMDKINNHYFVGPVKILADDSDDRSSGQLTQTPVEESVSKEAKDIKESKFEALQDQYNAIVRKRKTGRSRKLEGLTAEEKRIVDEFEELKRKRDQEGFFRGSSEAIDWVGRTAAGSAGASARTGGVNVVTQRSFQ
jgi:hypothetical protein